MEISVFIIIQMHILWITSQNEHYLRAAEALVKRATFWADVFRAVTPSISQHIIPAIHVAVKADLSLLVGKC